MLPQLFLPLNTVCLGKPLWNSHTGSGTVVLISSVVNRVDLPETGLCAFPLWCNLSSPEAKETQKNAPERTFLQKKSQFFYSSTP
jgi:hypothetical protein